MNICSSALAIVQSIYVVIMSLCLVFENIVTYRDNVIDCEMLNLTACCVVYSCSVNFCSDSYFAVSVAFTLS